MELLGRLPKALRGGLDSVIAGALAGGAPKPSWVVVDDGDRGYQEDGDDFLGNLSPVAAELAFGEDYRFRSVDGVDDLFVSRWTFADLAPGTYDVLATWPEADSRSPGVSYAGSAGNLVVDFTDDGGPLASGLVAEPDPAPIASVGETFSFNTDARTNVYSTGTERTLF